MTDNRFVNKSELIGILLLAAFLVVILPLGLDVFRLNLVAKYLTYAFVALGLVICWGYGGILSLGQGVFFGLGGYCMAMFLKLEASSVAFPAISGGAYGWDLADVARIGVRTVRTWANGVEPGAAQGQERAHRIELVRFVLSSAAALEAFRDELGED